MKIRALHALIGGKHSALERRLIRSYGASTRQLLSAAGREIAKGFLISAMARNGIERMRPGGSKTKKLGQRQAPADGRPIMLTDPHRIRIDVRKRKVPVDPRALAAQMRAAIDAKLARLGPVEPQRRRSSTVSGSRGVR
jgi:hypothetical protein